MRLQLPSTFLGLSRELPRTSNGLLLQDIDLGNHLTHCDRFAALHQLPTASDTNVRVSASISVRVWCAIVV